MNNRYIFNNKLKYRLIRHLTYWIFIYFIFTIPEVIISNVTDHLWINLIYIPFHILGTYILLYVFLPIFINKNQKILPVGVFLIFFIILWSCLFIFADTIIKNIIEKRNLTLPYSIPNLSRRIYNMSILFFTITSIPVIITLAKKWYLSSLKMSESKREHIKSKLFALKNQLHPHFLFNTLNNIYSLSIDSNNAKLSNSISRISEILQYMIYKCDCNYISLVEELKIINYFIELEKLRYSDINIQINIDENLNGEVIPPLMIFTFIENAFKHGIKSTLKNKYLFVSLKKDKKNLMFHLKNSKGTKLNYNTAKNNGIGIKNTIERLNLVYGENNFSIKINNETAFYEVFLKLKTMKNEI